MHDALPAVLGRVGADKKFIADLAKKGVQTCATKCITPATATAIIESVHSKNLALAEFATMTLQTFCTAADPSFHDSYFESSLHIVSNLSSVIESKKTRMVKYAQPAMLLIK